MPEIPHVVKSLNYPAAKPFDGPYRIVTIGENEVRLVAEGNDGGGFIIPSMPVSVSPDQKHTESRKATIRLIAQSHDMMQVLAEFIKTAENSRIDLHGHNYLRAKKIMANIYDESIINVEKSNTKYPTQVSLEHFMQQKILMDDLSEVINNFEGPTKGYLYPGNCYIEVLPEGKYFLSICRDEYVSENLSELEKILYEQWYLSECV